ncbi:MAG TPA: helix-turn-helix domain-containing protein [Methylomirabilota bacterium]|nr:helix-turn-helix domain-containing protein [Methylomirabilota bacterium]
MSNTNLSGLPLSLLNYFRANTSRVITRNELSEVVWHLKLHPMSRSIDQTISVVRKHLGTGEQIVHVRNVGYRHEGQPVQPLLGKPKRSISRVNEHAEA